MVTAFVMLEVAPDRIPETAEAVAALEGVREVYSVTGDVDLVAIVRVPRHEDLADVITHHLSKVDDVRATRTYLAFRAYSADDVSSAFDLGLEN